jgi:molybdopterin synthase sulfur carrier subunit
VARPITLVTFMLPWTLRHLVDHREEVRVFAVAARDERVPTLGAAFDTLRRTHPSLEERLRDRDGHIRRHMGVYVCGENARRLGGLSCGLPPGAEIHVLPALE